MASSSVSQESLDMDDFDNTARRNRIRVHRGHSGRGSLPYRTLPDRGDGVDQDREGRGGDHHNGDVGDGGGGGLGLSSHSHLPGDHESPTRGAAARLKDKRSRANHMKGKLPKDKRKLREKRRSTGVVHCMPSTESTGDSLDDEDDDEDVSHDTKRNTTFNEGGSAGHHHHQTLYETRHSASVAYSHQRRNKSPSDLEADLEDNQDYDSTVSHSETNLTLIGRSESSDMSQNLPNRPLCAAGTGLGRFGGGVGITSKFSPESNRAAFKFNPSNMSSDADSPRTNTPSTSSSSSILSRYREMDSPHTTTSSANNNNNTSTSSGPPDPDSPRRFNNNSNNNNNNSSSIGGGSAGSTSSSSTLSSQIQPRPVGFSVFRDRDSTTATSAGGGVLGSSSSRGDKPPYSSSLVGSRFGRDRDGGASGAAGAGSAHSRLASYQSPRPFVSMSSSSAAMNQQQTETISQLEKQLDKEKEENKRLQQQLEEKDKKIAELEKAIELLNTECDGLDEDNLKLQEENKALIRAMSKLTTNV
ncbi:myosin-G heavy chain [Aplysia californica]|uniref:Myosin-G heavy chain n=1 Tax=Aplysia californica TaxID=6500 RepID=A0ABM0JBT5_APLCA|nr:myosin-G heavy chain [Aplysia californica]